MTPAIIPTSADASVDFSPSPAVAGEGRGEGAVCSSPISVNSRSLAVSSSPSASSVDSSSLSLYDFPATTQDSVRLKLDIMRAMKSSTNKRNVIAKLSDGKRGMSMKRLYALHALWLASGEDWTVLLDKRQWADMWERKEALVRLPSAFLDWVGGQMLGNQRATGSQAAWRGILYRWESWLSGDNSPKVVIPGYKECPPVGPGRTFPRHPAGWSYQNLMRRAHPPKAECVMARIGTVTAKSLLPHVPGTRVGARWLEYVMFDDVWLDRKVITTRSIYPVRVLQLGGLDLATGLYLKFGQRPFLTDEEGKREGLKRTDFLALVAAFLEEYGYPADYIMHIILERGTATLSAAEARILYDLSEGHIICGYTSMRGQMVHAWDEKKTGNSSGKPHIESWHNLYHNETGHLLGQMGKDRASSPALMEAMERETTSLMKLGQMLTPEQRAELQMPHPSMEQCYFQSLEAVHRINNRPKHNLEGFDKVSIWRVPGTTEWHSKAEFAAAMQINPGIEKYLEWNTRIETPYERAQRLSRGVRMVKLPSNIWTRFYEDSHTLATVKRGGIAIKDQDSGRTICFGVADPEMQTIPDGTEVLAYYAPHNPEKVYITVNGRFAAEWPRIAPGARGDTEATSEGIRRKQAWINHTAANIQNKRAESLQIEEQRMSHNLAVFESAGISVNQRSLAVNSVPSDGRAPSTLRPSASSADNSSSSQPGASALQEIGKRMESAKQARAIDPIKSILASSDADEKSPAVHDNDWAQ